jgi:hypothetical protein
VRILDLPSRLWRLGRQMREALEVVDARLRALEDRMTHLEASQGQLVVQAREAAQRGFNGRYRISDL